MENINHHFIYSQKRTVNKMIDINISSLSKEKETQEHLKYIKQMFNTQDNQMIIYTDGSKISESEDCGAGLAYSKDNKLYSLNYWNIEPNCEVFDAELFAIRKAFDMIQLHVKKNSRIKIFTIYSDSQAALKRLKENNLSAGQAEINKIILIIQRIHAKNSDINISINWVPAHMNIKGNEMADKAAKIGTRTKAFSQDKTVSLSFIKRNIKLNCLNK